ncbi:hypothetical protein HMPREF1144_5636 [Klebsiella sp. OBRC7]|nr:hypothetical protein HMPREF1144_5636 [Klebsiella sp. OBRC7]
MGCSAARGRFVSVMLHIIDALRIKDNEFYSMNTIDSGF